MYTMVWLFVGAAVMCGLASGRPTEVTLEEVYQSQLVDTTIKNDEVLSGNQIVPTSSEHLEGNDANGEVHGESTESKSDEKTVDEEITPENKDVETANNEEHVVSFATVVKSSSSSVADSDENEE